MTVHQLEMKKDKISLFVYLATLCERMDFQVKLIVDISSLLY